MKRTGTRARSAKWLEKHGKTIFTIIVLIVLGVISALFVLKQPPDFALSARISNLPGNYSRVLIITTNLKLQMDEDAKSDFEEFVDGLAVYDISPTVFVAISDGQTEDIAYLSGFDSVDFGMLNPPDTRFSTLSYDAQESALWSYKELLTDLNPQGFRTYYMGASYDTVLAAENAQLDYFSGIKQFGDPQHPDSVLGGKLHLLLFPVVDTDALPITQEVWTVSVPPTPSSITLLNPVLKNDSILKLSMSQASEWLRQKDKIEIQISSDMKELVSSVRVTRPLENASLGLLSTLSVENITTGNGTVTYSYRNGELLIPLSPNHRSFLIQWSE